MARKSLYGIAAILLGIIAGLGLEYSRYIATQNAQADAQAQQTLATLKNEIQALVSTVETEADRLADSLRTGDFTQQQVRSEIAESAAQIPALKGVTACYEPFAFDADTRLFCPFYTKETGA